MYFIIYSPFKTGVIKITHRPQEYSSAPPVLKLLDPPLVAFWLVEEVVTSWSIMCVCGFFFLFSMTERTRYLQGDGGSKYLFSVVCTTWWQLLKQKANKFNPLFIYCHTVFTYISRTYTLQYSGSLNQLNTSAFWLLTSANFRIWFNT